mmetsp:Transcript_95203/g.179053  ORF Transcript_95203/g.179053 Transcript_95203/m.179053 type:complete len:213 (-) Transcript_95203:415-1053(-)
MSSPGPQPSKEPISLYRWDLRLVALVHSTVPRVLDFIPTVKTPSSDIRTITCTDSKGFPLARQQWLLEPSSSGPATAVVSRDMGSAGYKACLRSRSRTIWNSSSPVCPIANVTHHILQLTPLAISRKPQSSLGPVTEYVCSKTSDLGASAEELTSFHDMALPWSSSPHLKSSWYTAPGRRLSQRPSMSQELPGLSASAPRICVCWFALSTTG